MKTLTPLIALFISLAGYKADFQFRNLSVRYWLNWTLRGWAFVDVRTIVPDNSYRSDFGCQEILLDVGITTHWANLQQTPSFRPYRSIIYSAIRASNQGGSSKKSPAYRICRWPYLGNILRESCCVPRHYTFARMICNQ